MPTKFARRGVDIDVSGRPEVSADVALLVHVPQLDALRSPLHRLPDEGVEITVVCAIGTDVNGRGLASVRMRRHHASPLSRARPGRG